MPLNDISKIKLCILIPYDKKYQPIKEAIKTVSKETGVKLSFAKKTYKNTILNINISYSEIMSSDLVVADTSIPSPSVFYEIGLAHAIGKPVVLLSQEKTPDIPLDLRGVVYIQYAMTQKGMKQFQALFKGLLEDYVRYPRRFRSFLPIPTKFIEAPYIIDLEKLEPREFENLCFELITQMGFRRVEWGKEFRDIDAIATLSKKDPDGYEYEELWFISMGRRAPAERMLECFCSVIK